MKLSFEEYVATELAPKAPAHDKPTILLLTCIDYRYAHRIVDVMDSKGLRSKYDIFSLAGAAAGGNQKPKWREVLIEHIEVARRLNHLIDRVIILEHRNCGAYEVFFGLEWAAVKPPIETEYHQREVELLATALKNHFRTDIPNLKVDAFLLARDEDDPLPIVAAKKQKKGKK
jgi:carbonic anhydrase